MESSLPKRPVARGRGLQRGYHLLWYNSILRSCCTLLKKLQSQCPSHCCLCAKQALPSNCTLLGPLNNIVYVLTYKQGVTTLLDGLLEEQGGYKQETHQTENDPVLLSHRWHWATPFLIVKTGANKYLLHRVSWLLTMQRLQSALKM